MNSQDVHCIMCYTEHPSNGIESVSEIVKFGGVGGGGENKSIKESQGTSHFLIM